MFYLYGVGNIMRLDHFSWILDTQPLMYFRVKESITDFPLPKAIFIRQFPPFDFDRVPGKKILRSQMCFPLNTFPLNSRDYTSEKKDITR